MLMSVKAGSDFSRGCADETIGHSILKTHAPTDSRIESRQRQSRQRRTGLTTIPFARSGTLEALAHKLVDVVAVAVNDLASHHEAVLRNPWAL